MDSYSSIVKKLKDYTKFLLVSHYNPDGDAIGSTIALGLALKWMGKEVCIYNRDGVPANLRFLPSAGLVVSRLDKDAQFDMTIMADCASRKRVSDEFASFSGTGEVLCIDHHILDSAESDISLLDERAASTGGVVLRLIEKLGVKVNASIAQCVYTTLAVDTGFFKYSNTDAHVFSAASEMVRAGADPWVVAKGIEESYPASRWKLLALSFMTLEMDLGGRYAAMDVTFDMLKKTGATIEETDEFASYPRSIAGVEVSALFREMEGGKVKVSLRSKDHVDVSAIARSFGGGGHVRAAGFQLKVTLAEAKARVRKALSHCSSLVTRDS